MCGGTADARSRAIIGVCITDDPKESQFLELDPHIWDAAVRNTPLMR